MEELNRIIIVINSNDEKNQVVLNDYYTEINSYKDFFPGIFTYHWHNMWKKEIHEDSYFGLFNKEFDSLLLQKFPT